MIDDPVFEGADSGFFFGAVKSGREIGIVRYCGCWRVNLAQGIAVLPCAQHQDAVDQAAGREGL